MRFIGQVPRAKCHSVNWKGEFTHTISCRRRAPTILCCDLEKSLLEQHGRSMAGARHGHGMVFVNQTRPHSVNQMGKTRSKPMATRYGRGTAWARRVMCELALTSLAALQSTGT